MADRFYINSDLAVGLVVIRGPEAHHLGAVRRIRPGDAVCLFNGDGNEYPGHIVEVTRRDVTVAVTSQQVQSRELAFSLHLAVPLPKGDRAQFLVEKLTEVGVTALTVLSTERSVVQPRDAKLDKLERYVIEASKQCGRNVLMRIEGVRAWRDFVENGQFQGQKVLAHPGGKASLGQVASGDVVAAVGPEGGFTEEEVTTALAAGWRAVQLGPRILRVETAAVVLAARLALG